MHARNGRWAEINHVHLNLRRLHPRFDGFRLVQISDIHFGTWINADRLEEAVGWVNEQEPDVVAVTGDFISARPDRYSDPLIAVLSLIRARSGVVAVKGNHDHWTDPQAVGEIITRSGMTELSNRVQSIERGPACLHLAGVDCFYVGRARLDRVLEKLPDEGAAILLAHEPDFAEQSASTGRFDLQISGHSHGGQVVLPWIGAPILPRFARKYPAGKYQINGMIQYTNRGIGTAHLRIRINCPPEITVFHLHAGA